MQLLRGNRRVVLALALYFGWLLSFPFYGPVLEAVAPAGEYRGFSLPAVFIFFHILSFSLAGLLLRQGEFWKGLMWLGLGLSLVTVTALPFAPPAAWPWALAVLGVAAALFTMGWSFPFTFFLAMGERLKVMATVIIGSNLIYIVLNNLSLYLAPLPLLLLSSVPLWLTLLLLFFFPPAAAPGLFLPAPEKGAKPFPAALLLIICLFVAGLYLSSGFMYKVMQPYLSAFELPDPLGQLLVSYRYLPYVFALAVIWFYGERLQRYFLIYMGASLLGLAFVSFALLYRSAAGVLLTAVLAEASFALLDLYIWTLLGDLAFIYGAPFPFFGYALSAMLLSILSGELIGAELLKIGEQYRLVTALFAATALYLTYTVIPWLSGRMQREYGSLLAGSTGGAETAPGGAAEKKGGEEDAVPGGGAELLDRALNSLLPGQKLTPREMEITALLLKGRTNREIAAGLYISENTLKTHLRNIYHKFGVGQKKELLELVRGEQPSG